MQAGQQGPGSFRSPAFGVVSRLCLRFSGIGISHGRSGSIPADEILEISMLHLRWSMSHFDEKCVYVQFSGWFMRLLIFRDRARSI